MALRTFRLWTRLVESPDMGETRRETGHSMDRNSARMVWKAYYKMLSSFLQNGVLYGSSVRPIADFAEEPARAPQSLSDEDYIELKLRQREDLKHVEATYEALLLRETRFPKANESNEEVLEWVETVMANWRVLCGPSWQDEELGEGGKDSVGRNTLDVRDTATTRSEKRLPLPSDVSWKVHADTRRFCTAQLQKLSTRRRFYVTYSPYIARWRNLTLG